jgi:hypothetical protein
MSASGGANITLDGSAPILAAVATSGTASAQIFCTFTRDVTRALTIGTTASLSTLGGADIAKSLRVGTTIALGAGSATPAISAFDVDGTFAANSDSRLATQRATRTYISAQIAPLAQTVVTVGFVDRAQSVISFVSATRIFTIAPAGGAPNFEYYVADCAKFTSASAQNFTIANSSGIHLIYFGATGTLAETVIAPSDVFPDALITTQCLVAAITWNVADATAIHFADKRYGIHFPRDAQNFASRNCAMVSGFAPGNFSLTGAGTTAVDAQFTVASGILLDADMSRAIAGKAAIADTIPIYYPLGASDAPTWKVAQTTGAFYSLADGSGLQKSALAAGFWVLATVANSNFTVAHLFATDGDQICAILGCVSASTMSGIRALAPLDLRAVIARGLPFAHWTPIASIIMRTHTTEYTNVMRAVVVRATANDIFYDWRIPAAHLASRIIPHSHLAQLDEDDHAQYFATTGRAGEPLIVRSADDMQTATVACTNAGILSFAADTSYNFASTDAPVLIASNAARALDIVTGGARIGATAEVGALTLTASAPTSITAIDTDVAMSANSDSRLATQRACRSYVDEVSRAIYFNGFADLAETTMTFVGGATHTLSLARTGTSFTFYSANHKFVKTDATDSITIAGASSGMHYVYYDDTGMLRETTVWSDDLIITYCTVAAIYWNVATLTAIHVGDERHGIILSPPATRAFYYGVGTTYISGLLPSAFTIGDGSLASHAQFACATGAILDADIAHTIAAKGAASAMRVIYRGSSEWSATSQVGAFLLSDGALQYNSVVNNVGTLVPVISGQYVLGHLIATNEGIICAILGQATYDSLISARNNAASEATRLYRGASFPLRKYVIIATIIYQYGSGFASAYKCRVIPYNDDGANFFDWREVADAASGGGGAGGITSHHQLADLDEDDHAQYFTTSGRAGESLTMRGASGSATGTISVADSRAMTVDGASYTFAGSATQGGVQIISSRAADALDVAGGINARANVAVTGEVRLLTAPASPDFARLYADGEAIHMDATAGTAPLLRIHEAIERVAIENDDATESIATGALTVAGGAAFAQDVRVGDALILHGTDVIAARIETTVAGEMTFTPAVAGVGFTFAESAGNGGAMLIESVREAESSDETGALTVDGSIVTRAPAFFASRATFGEYLTDAIFIASFAHDVSADFARESLHCEYHDPSAEARQSAPIVDGALNLNVEAQTIALWASFDARSNLSAEISSAATFFFEIVKEVGAPATTQCLFSMGAETGIAAPRNLLRLNWIATSGNLIFDLRDATGSAIITSGSFGAWTDIAGTYTFQLSYDLIAGEARLYIADVQKGATLTFASGTFTRDNELGRAYFARDVANVSPDAARPHFRVRNFVVMPRAIAGGNSARYKPNVTFARGIASSASVDIAGRAKFRATDPGDMSGSAPVEMDGGAEIRATTHLGSNVAGAMFCATFARDFNAEISSGTGRAIVVGTVALPAVTSRDDIDSASITFAGTSSYLQYNSPIDRAIFADALLSFTVVCTYSLPSIASGIPTSDQVIFSVANDAAGGAALFELIHVATSGTLVANLRDNSGTLILNRAQFCATFNANSADPISAQSGRELRVTFAPTTARAGVATLFVDGEQLGDALDYSSATTDIIPICAYLRIGASLNIVATPLASSVARFAVRDFAIFRDVMRAEIARLNIRATRADGVIEARAISATDWVSAGRGMRVGAAACASIVPIPESAQSSAPLVSYSFTPTGAVGDTFQMELNHVSESAGLSYVSRIGCNAGALIFDSPLGFTFRNSGPVCVENAVGASGAGIGALVVTGGAAIGEKLRVASTATATSSAGAIYSAGGIRATNAYFTSSVRVANTTVSTSITTGAVIIDGGIGLAKNIWANGAARFGGALTIADTTASTSTTTGCAIFAGGAGFAGTSTFGATVTFAGTPPICAILPSISSHLANKAYVDAGTHWLAPVAAFYDLAAGNPPDLVDGVRYVATVSGATFTAQYIYTWVASSSTWFEFAPTLGSAIYVTRADSVLFAHQCAIFDGTTWVSFGATMDHQLLIGAGTLTHAVIDARLGQAVNTTSDPTFSTITASHNGTVAQISARNDSGAEQLTIFATQKATYAEGRAAIYFASTGTNPALYIGSAPDGTTNVSRVVFAGTDPATSATTGCATFAGGIGVADASYFGSLIRFSNTITRKKIVMYDNGNDYQWRGFSIDSSQVRYQTNAISTRHAFYAGTGVSADQELMRIEGNLAASAGVVIRHTQVATDASTGALVVAGGIATGASCYFGAGATFAGSALNITNVTPATSASTGALIVAGGIAAGATSYFADALTVVALASASTQHVISAINTFETSASVLNDAMPVLSLSRRGFTGLITDARAVFALDRYENVSTYARTKMTIQLRHNISDLVPSAEFYSTGRVNLPAVITSTSATTGALTVAGGAGFGGAIYGATTLSVPGDCGLTLLVDQIADTMQAGTYAKFSSYYNPGVYFNRRFSGADHKWELTQLGGDEIVLYNRTGGLYAMRVQSNGQVRLPVNIASTNTTSGSMYVGGGAGFHGNVNTGGWCGMTFDEDRAAGLTGSFGRFGVGNNHLACVLNMATSGGTKQWNMYLHNTSYALVFRWNTNGVDALSIAAPSGQVSVLPNIASTSTTTGALIVTGGAGFGGSLNVGGTISVPAAPTESAHLTNKAYVDSRFTADARWLEPVISFYNFATPPVGPADGARYIASATSGAFTSQHIYTWRTSTSTWEDFAPTEGMATRVTGSSGSFALQCIIFVSSAWAALGSSTDHQSLIGAGTLTHATIDSYLDQAVKSTSSPLFTNVYASTQCGCKPLVAISTRFDVGSYSTMGTPGGNIGMTLLKILDGVSTRWDTWVARYTDRYTIGWNSPSLTEYFSIDTLGTVRVPTNIASTSATTGALVVTGGAGFGGAIYGATTLSVPGDCGLTLLADQISSMQAGTYAKFSSFSNPGVYFNRRMSGLDHKWELAQLPSDEICLYNRTSTLYSWISRSNGQFYISPNIASTSTTTGALVVAGGAGFGGSLNVGGTISVPAVPTESAHLTNKAYVDSRFTADARWLEPVISFYNFATPPVGPADGARYIASATAGAFTSQHIYTWRTSTSTWEDFAPTEGMATRVTGSSGTFALQCIIFVSSVWVAMGASVDHQSLIGAGTLTHATIDSYLDQAVKTTSDVLFSTATITRSGTLQQLTLVNNPSTEKLNFMIHRIASYPDGRAGIWMESAGTAPALYIGSHPNGTSLVSEVIMPGVTQITNATASTSATTGAFIVTGGAGITGNSFFGGSLYSAEYCGMTFTTDKAAGLTGSYGRFAIGNNHLACVLNMATAGGTKQWNMYLHNTSYALVFRWNTNGVDALSIAAPNGQVSVLPNIASTSATTGSLVVAGGAGFGGAIYGASSITAATNCGVTLSSGVANALAGSYAQWSTPSGYIGLILNRVHSTGSQRWDTYINASNGLTFYNSTGALTPLSIATSGDVTFGFRVTAATMTCTTAPSATTDVANKLYVDTRVNSHWFAPATRMFNFNEVPVGMVDGDRYIAESSVGVYVFGHVYTWVSASSTWVDNDRAPEAGDMIYSYEDHVGDPFNSYFCFISDDDGWLRIDSCIDHGYLKNNGVLTHAVIDSYLDQAVQTTSSPTWRGANAKYPASNGAFIDNLVTFGQTNVGVRNQGVLGLMYVASTNVGNYATIGLSGEAHVMRFYYNRIDAVKPLAISDTTASTSTATGALIVSGGAGFAGAMYVGGLARVTNTTASTSTTTGALVVSGGAGFAGRVTATNMTCSTVPSAATDVARLTDLSAFLTPTSTTFTPTMTVYYGESGSVNFPSSPTIYLIKVGNLVTCYSSNIISVSFTLSNTASITCSNPSIIPAAYRPVATSIKCPVEIYCMNSSDVSVSTMCFLSLSSGGVYAYQGINDGTETNGLFTNVKGFTIRPFCVTWATA